MNMLNEAAYRLSKLYDKDDPELAKIEQLRAASEKALGRSNGPVATTPPGRSANAP